MLEGRLMRIRSPKDFWAGLIFIAIGGGFVLLAQQYRLGDMHRMGPAMFPTLVGALLAALGLIVALRSFALDGAAGARLFARPARGSGLPPRVVRDSPPRIPRRAPPPARRPV